jgi:hypothetical protein
LISLRFFFPLSILADLDFTLFLFPVYKLLIHLVCLSFSISFFLPFLTIIIIPFIILLFVLIFFHPHSILLFKFTLLIFPGFIFLHFLFPFFISSHPDNVNVN